MAHDPDAPESERVWRIVFLDRETLSAETTLRPARFAHVLQLHAHTTADETAARIAAADIVITNKVPISAANLAGSRVRFIAVAATGYDIIDTAACQARGIIVSNIRGYAETSVPEHVFALVLALRRNLIAYRDAVAHGRWQAVRQFCFFDYPIGDLAGSTLGIIGYGRLGQATARIGAALGMHVQYAGRKHASMVETGRVAFETLLSSSDVITLHCPLTPETLGLIAEAEFALMARRPLLINVGRGGLVDEEALVRALDAGQIAGAGFDVTSPEPPPPSSVLMGLTGRANFILTPHVAWASRESMQALADQLMDVIEAFRAGAPRNRVA